MMEERYHATTQNWFYPDMYNVNKNITVEAKLLSPLTYIHFSFSLYIPHMLPTENKMPKIWESVHNWTNNREWLSFRNLLLK